VLSFLDKMAVALFATQVWSDGYCKTIYAPIGSIATIKRIAIIIFLKILIGKSLKVKFNQISGAIC